MAVLLARCPLGGGSCDKECATVEVEDEVATKKSENFYSDHDLDIKTLSYSSSKVPT